MPGRWFEGRWVEWVGRDVEHGSRVLCPACEEHFDADTWPGSFRIVPKRDPDGHTFYDAVATCSPECALW